MRRVRETRGLVNTYEKLRGFRLVSLVAAVQQNSICILGIPSTDESNGNSLPAYTIHHWGRDGVWRYIIVVDAMRHLGS